MQTCGGSSIKEQEDHENNARVRGEEVSFRDAPQIGEKLTEEKSAPTEAWNLNFLAFFIRL